MKRQECTACGSMHGGDRPLAAMRASVCDGCWSSNVKRTLVLEKATGLEQPCDCGGDCAKNRRTRGAA